MMQLDLFSTPVEEQEDKHTRECPKCNKQKPLDRFWHPPENRYQTATGKAAWCYDCGNAYNSVVHKLKKENPYKNTENICDCCGIKSDKKLLLDHDHITGEFRGWLCRNCNVGIGNLGDNIEGLDQAIAYLRKAYGLYGL